MALIKCPECGKEVSSTAKSCPNCGHPIAPEKVVEKTVIKEKKKGSCLSKIVIAIIVIAALAAIASNLGNNEEPQKVGSGENSGTETPEASSETEDISFSIGETAEQKGIQITLVSATESMGSDFVTPDSGNVFLLLEFDIANNSDSDISVSSIANFEAYCDGYATSQDIMGLQAPEGEGKSQLDGSVAAGKKMNGIIAYQVPADYKEFEINVSPDFWSSRDIKFVITK